MIARRLTRSAALAAACALAAVGAEAPRAQAEGSGDVHPDYIVQRFTANDGLPSDHVTGVAVEPGGYLWVTTLGGLARFDGHAFTTFTLSDTPTLGSNRLSQPAVTVDGSVWVRTEPGDVIRYDGRGFESSLERYGFALPIRFQIDERRGAWMATGRGLWEWAGGSFVRRWPRLLPGPVGGVYGEDRDTWAVAQEAVLHFRDGALRARYPIPASWRAGWISRAATGQMWLATAGGPAWLQGGRFERLTPDQDPALSSRQESPSGAWDTMPAIRRALGVPERPGEQATETRTGAGIFPRVDEGPGGASWRVVDGWVFRDDVPVYHLGDEAQLSAGTYVPFVLDEDGALWVGGRSLHRIQRRAVSVISAEEGLGGRNVYPVLAASDGAVWAGLWYQDADLSRITGSRPTPVDLGEGVYAVTALMEDREGAVWAAAIEGDPYGTVYRLRDGRRQRVDIGTPPERIGGIGALAQSRDGSVWVGGTFQIARGVPSADGWTWTARPVRFKLNALVETSGGEMLLASGGGGLGRASADGRAIEWLTTDHGLASDQVRDVYEDERGVLWIATEDQGLCRLDRAGRRSLRAGSLGCISTRQGLFHDSLHRILPDGQGRLWVNSNGGLFAFDRARADSVAAGHQDRLWVLALTEADGLRSAEGNGSMQPAGSRSADGRLWFPTQDGVAVVDPTAVDMPAPPAAHIGATEGGAVTDGGVVLAPGERDLRVSYAAVELAHPDRVRYRVRLDGYDEAWREVGDRREAAFTNLAAGTYTFRVQARTTGAWGREATLFIRRQPLFWETVWFRALLALAVPGALAGLVWLRLRVLARRQRALERTIAERTADLRRANEVKSRFLANVSHELRTPLTLLLGPLRDLQRGRFAVAPEAAPLLERAEINGTRLERLIADLLALSRIDAGGLELSLERVEVVAFARARVSAFGSRPSAGGVNLGVEAEGPVWAVVDPVHLETILYNLVDNALRFTPRGGRVTVRVASEAGGGVRLAVQDTGTGVDEDSLARLFERFYQAATPAPRAGAGVGIGLALVREVVELHGGTVGAESTPGEGTCVTVRLPALELPAGRQPGPPALAAPTDPPPLPTFGDGQTGPAPILDSDERPVVLVVEDHPDLRAYLRTLLESAYAVEEAPDGAAGIERAIDLVPDLIVSDVAMPRASGFDLLDAVKADERTSHVPVLLLTARADAESRVAGFRGGADAYVDKPFNAAELEARVDGLIANRLRLRDAWSRAAAAPGTPTPEDALPPAEAAFVERVDAQIAERLGDGRFGATQLADDLGLSERQLRRKLRAVTGESPGARLRRLRVEEGARLLATGTHTVQSAACAVGYADAEGFRRAFVSVRGEQPSQAV